MDQLRPPGAAMPFPAPRRHSTVPTSFQPTPSRTMPTQTTSGSVETLFSHPSVKIIAFSAGKSAFDGLGSNRDEKPGSLQSSSQFERIIAIGTSIPRSWCYNPAYSTLLIPALYYRWFPDLSSPWFRCLPTFRISLAANSSQKSMLVSRRRVRQIRSTNSTSQLLADRSARGQRRGNTAGFDTTRGARQDPTTGEDTLPIREKLHGRTARKTHNTCKKTAMDSNCTDALGFHELASGATGYSASRVSHAWTVLQSECPSLFRLWTGYNEDQVDVGHSAPEI